MEKEGFKGSASAPAFRGKIDPPLWRTIRDIIVVGSGLQIPLPSEATWSGLFGPISIHRLN